MKAFMSFFLSLTTTFWALLIFILLAFVGSLYLVNNLAFFSGIDDVPLFSWLLESEELKKTWWIYVMIATLAILAINTIFCTVEAMYKRLGRTNIALTLSPQVMHIGVLFIMLGHLLTASIGFKTDITVIKGQKRPVTDTIAMSVDDIKVQTDENGYFTDWQANILWFEEGRRRHEDILRPLHPLYFGQFGLYIRSVTTEPEESVLIRVSSDPGALWAGIGGLLLSAGGLTFLYAKGRQA